MTTRRTWKNVNSSDAEEIKEYLKKEVWRKKLKHLMKSGELDFLILPLLTTRKELFTVHPQIRRIRQYSMRGNRFCGRFCLRFAHQRFFIGLDKTGKGEVIGHTVLTGVIFPKELFKDADLLIGPADTKNRQKFEY